MPDYDELRRKRTNGLNYDVSTDDIIGFFQRLETRCRFALSEIGHDRVTILFETLPDELDELAVEIYHLCPDTVDQGFGVLGEQIEMIEESDEEIPEDLQALVEGIDLTDDDYGIEVMARSIEITREIQLWWD